MAENMINSVTVNGTNYQIGIPTASADEKGGVKVGKGLVMNEDKLNISLGVGLSFDNENNIKADFQNYELPTASADEKGGVKVGKGLIMNEDETINLNLLNSNITTYKIPAEEQEPGNIDNTDYLWVNDAYKKDTTSWPMGTSNNWISINEFNTEGLYKIDSKKWQVSGKDTDLPFQSETSTGVRGRLTVLEKNGYLGQLLNILQDNGDLNIYTRTALKLNEGSFNWNNWAKLQTNIEVGAIDQTKMDSLIDNGIYSGILNSTNETFVLICINNYEITTRLNSNLWISHLLYSVDLNGNVKVKIRNRDAYGIWSDWSDIGNNYELPAATTNGLGGIQIADKAYLGDNNYGLLSAYSSYVNINSVEHIINIDSNTKRLKVKEYPNNTTFICEEPVEILLPTRTDKIVNHDLNEIMNYTIIYKELDREPESNDAVYHDDGQYLFVMLDTSAVEPKSINSSDKVLWENLDTIPTISHSENIYHKFILKAYTETKTDGIYNINEDPMINEPAKDNGKVQGNIITGNYFVTYSKYKKLS